MALGTVENGGGRLGGPGCWIVASPFGLVFALTASSLALSATVELSVAMDVKLGYPSLTIVSLT